MLSSGIKHLSTYGGPWRCGNLRCYETLNLVVSPLSHSSAFSFSTSFHPLEKHSVQSADIDRPETRQREVSYRERSNHRESNQEAAPRRCLVHYLDMRSSDLVIRDPPNRDRNSSNIDRMNQSVDQSATASTTTNLFPTTTQSRGSDSGSGPGSANVYYLVVSLRCPPLQFDSSTDCLYSSSVFS